MDRFYFYKYEFGLRIVKILVSMSAFKAVYVKKTAKLRFYRGVYRIKLRVLTLLDITWQERMCALTLHIAR